MSRALEICQAHAARVASRPSVAEAHEAADVGITRARYALAGAA